MVAPPSDPGLICTQHLLDNIAHGAPRTPTACVHACTHTQHLVVTSLSAFPRALFNVRLICRHVSDARHGTRSQACVIQGV